MSDPAVETLILDLLEWINREERTYAEVMDAWRTSCPRFPIWEEASDRGLIHDGSRQASSRQGYLGWSHFA